MKIIKNFTRPVTMEELNAELSGVGAPLLEIVKNGAEGLDLYFASCFDGLADCLRLSAQRGPQGVPVLAVEYLPAEGENAQQDPAEGAKENDTE